MKCAEAGAVACVAVSMGIAVIASRWGIAQYDENNRIRASLTQEREYVARLEKELGENYVRRI